MMSLLSLFFLGATARLTEYGISHGLKEIDVCKDNPLPDGSPVATCAEGKAQGLCKQMPDAARQYCSKTCGFCSDASNDLDDLEGCCRGHKAECMACQIGITTKEFNEKFTDFATCEAHMEGDLTSCCHSKTAPCVACQTCTDLDDFCAMVHMPGCRPAEDSVWEGWHPELGCCRGHSVECMACQIGISPKKFQKKFPDFNTCNAHHQKGELESCCHSKTADCLACQTCTDFTAFCSRVTMDGCPKALEYEEEEETNEVWEGWHPQLGCCRGHYPKCMACQAGISVDDFNTLFPDFSTCNEHMEGKLQHCCHSKTPECVACQVCTDEPAFCKKTKMTGCSFVLEDEEELGGCCRGHRVECMACQIGITDDVFNQKFPDFSTCEAHLEGEVSVEQVLRSEQPWLQSCCHGKSAPCVACQTCTDLDDFCYKVKMTGCPKSE